MNGHPTDRYTKDVAGMPVFAATEKFIFMLSPESMAKAIPRDDEHCAIAEGCRTQLRTPYVSVGRSRTDLAMPHPLGVKKPGHGETLWAVIRFANSKEAKDIVIAADTGKLGAEGATVKLMPPRPSLFPAVKQERNKRFREGKGIKDGRGIKDKEPDALTAMGVRTLIGQRRSETA